MPRRPAWSGVNSGGKGASSGVTSGVEVSLHKVSLHKVSPHKVSPHKVSPHKVSLHKNSSYKLVALFQFLVDLMGGTDETLSGDLRVARGHGVRSATASAAGRDQPAAPSAGAPAATEVTPFRPQFADAVQPVSCHVRGGAMPSRCSAARIQMGGNTSSAARERGRGCRRGAPGCAATAGGTQVLEGSVERWKEVFEIAEKRLGRPGLGRRPLFDRRHPSVSPLLAVAWRGHH
jgi:hypothetical protein